MADDVKQYRVQSKLAGGDKFIDLSDSLGSADVTVAVQHAKDMKKAAPLNTYRVVDQDGKVLEIKLPDSYKVQVEATPEAAKVWVNTTGPVAESYDDAVAEVEALEAANPKTNCRIVDLQGNVVDKASVDQAVAAIEAANQAAIDKAAAEQAEAEKAAADKAAAEKAEADKAAAAAGAPAESPATSAPVTS